MDELCRCDGLTIERLQDPVNGKNGGWKRIKSFLGAFAKLRKATISFVMSVCLSVRPSVRPPAWNSSAPTAWICMRFYILIFSKIC